MVAAALVGGDAFVSKRADLAVGVRPVPGHRRAPTIAAAVVYGIATSVRPLVVLFPSLGYGPPRCTPARRPRPARITLVGHSAFGAGIGLGSALVVLRRR